MVPAQRTCYSAASVAPNGHDRVDGGAPSLKRHRSPPGARAAPQESQRRKASAGEAVTVPKGTRLTVPSGPKVPLIGHF
jgi:hypothetical protein